MKECGAGYCCGSMTDLNTGEALDCNVCGPTTGTGGNKWFMRNSSGIIITQNIMYQCNYAC